MASPGMASPRGADPKVCRRTQATQVKCRLDIEMGFLTGQLDWIDSHVAMMFHQMLSQTNQYRCLCLPHRTTRSQRTSAIDQGDLHAKREGVNNERSICRARIFQQTLCKQECAYALEDPIVATVTKISHPIIRWRAC